jgi:hypothetical protein
MLLLLLLLLLLLVVVVVMAALPCTATLQAKPEACWCTSQPICQLHCEDVQAGFQDGITGCALLQALVQQLRQGRQSPHQVHHAAAVDVGVGVSTGAAAGVDFLGSTAAAAAAAAVGGGGRGFGLVEGLG